MDCRALAILVWTCIAINSNLVQSQNEETVKNGDNSICERGTNLCFNGGTCTPNKSKRKYRCDCPGNFTGAKCQQYDSCHSLPCKHGGECINRNGGYVCRCERPYEGRNCENVPVNNCDSLPCKNGGECINTKKGFNCKCLPAYKGDTCEQDSGVKEQCRNITAKLSPRCCSILNKCCMDEPRDFVCGTGIDGRHPVLYYNKCELKKARCLHLDQCILKRNESQCRVDHAKLMSRPTPCDTCPCQGMETSNNTIADIVRLYDIRENFNSNCTVECDSSPPKVPFCLMEALNKLEPESIWDSL